MTPEDNADPNADPNAAAAAPAPEGASERAAATPEPEQTVKQILDAKTLADLERWFGLPSFQEVAERGEPPPALDPEIEAVREQRAKAIAAVDPALVEAHRRRVESGESLLRFEAVLEVRVDPSVAQIDYAHIENKQAIAEPREVDIPEQLRDDLRECTPQAILRDLHRPELYFDKQFEVVDMAAEQRLDIVAAVAEAMRTSWKLPPLPPSLATEGRALIAELKEDRMRSIAHLLHTFPNRRVTEP
ncbi:MAG TPA: hypothetical protein VNO30_28330 [Kofleriaceae bacterium]|nr:hypothetical protein [Kofleriaceae bacterium]